MSVSGLMKKRRCAGTMHAKALIYWARENDALEVEVLSDSCGAKIRHFLIGRGLREGAVKLDTMLNMDQNYKTVEGAVVGVLMGSASDWPTMSKTSETLREFGIVHECNVISAHRNAERVASYCGTAEQRGLKAIICAAGGAAHLAGVVAALTPLPVLACPMKAWSLEGLDSLLSMAQMPKGVPVATFAIGSAGAINAALFAVSMLGLSDDAVRQRYASFRAEQSAAVQELPE